MGNWSSQREATQILKFPEPSAVLEDASGDLERDILHASVVSDSAAGEGALPGSILHTVNMLYWQYRIEVSPSIMSSLNWDLTFLASSPENSGAKRKLELALSFGLRPAHSCPCQTAGQLS